MTFPLHSSFPFLPDLLTAVIVFASSTAEIAAASLGEESIVGSLRPMEEKCPALPALEVLAESEKEANAEADVETPADATPDSGEEETSYAEEGRPEEEATSPRVEESEVPLENPAIEEASLPGNKSAPEEIADAEESAAEGTPAIVRSTQVEEGTEPSAGFEADGGTAHMAEADSEGPDGDIPPVITEPCLTSEAPVNEAEHCSACHAPDNAEEGVAPPAEFGVKVQEGVHGNHEESMELAEATEGVSPVEGKPAGALSVVAARL